MRSVLVIAAVLLVALGCGSRPSASPPATAPEGNVVFRDASNHVVATANVQLPEKLPTPDGTFTGDWELLSSKPGFPADSTKSGSYKGTVDGGMVSINLNPGVSDSNVVLAWSAGAEPITGTWYHATFAGGKSKGTFTLTRPPGKAR